MQTLAQIIIAPLIFVMSLAGYSVVPQKTFDSLNSKINEQQVKIESQGTKLGAFTTTSAGTYRLSNSISSTLTTINLSSFKEPVSNIAYTMSYIGTSVAYGTLDPQLPTKTETISFTGITQNSDGTAQLTGVTRGLSRTPSTSACTASTTLATSHSGQSVFILSNPSCFYSEFAVKRNDESITGAWSGITPTASGNFATKGYVDSVVGGVVSTNKVTVAGTAGETVSAGQVLYLKQSDQRWYKAGTTILEASSSPLGISQGAGTAASSISGGILTGGIDSNQSGLTGGRNYFLSSTAGTMGVATTSRVVGRAGSASTLYFDSSFIPNVSQNNNFLGVNTFSTTTIHNAILQVNGATTTLATTTINGYSPWGLIASTSATSGNSMTLSGFPARDNFSIEVMASTTVSQNTDMTITFNGDSGANYTYTTASTTKVGQTYWIPYGSYNQIGKGVIYTKMNVMNNPSSFKLITSQSALYSFDGTSFPSSASSTLMYLNATNRISSITVTLGGLGGTGTLLSGFIKVYGDTSNP